ncbi:WD40-like beta Propeller containing protein [Pseudopedobacter saltans DSM 12145]|uniref:WD40-like beta Propeller containing protein n=1 Tax=Pseudopedobacter saltans (strain ATCC 51119 / DSM 12145 / JCM 21818 / CCUG 39354 / LMG 10337 / NBRC 100064 / NCIMB 13643) TaxID=762903 RepID=F0SD15_PSESL|nr:WD40-like beta Propeller containing protein [Pseudopedobacter saltans DSM 12145]
MNMTHTNFNIKRLLFVFFSLTLLAVGYPSKAQYFGQNKVRYKNLKFKVYETPHFHLYYYTKNDSVIKNFAKESEAWYHLHQQVFRDTFRKPNPIILYGNSPEFQQTTIIDGEIGVGTGGVTEGLKNRVFMPLQEINFQTRHVLGHELVHAFQYHSLIEGDSTQLENIGNLPLWMVEGMAEYLSLGKVDANTAMWMRDAVLNKDIPTLKDLTTNSKYFPYRYGQAFWAFIGSTYGDTLIMPFFKSTAKFGYEMAIRRTFGYDERTLSSLWKSALENTYRPLLKDSAQTKPIGTKLIDNVNGGEMNVAPAISPDGKYLAFLSEKDLFSIDLYLADAKTGKIIRKLTSRIKNSHIDEFNFIESAGAWSPDSKQFAFSAFSKGRNQLVIVDIESGRTLLEKAMGEVEQFGNITWSPNGKDLAFTGLQNGQSDIFSYNLDTQQITQLTNDKYTDFQPSYSTDGKKIVFSTDRLDLDKGLSAYISMNLAVLDLATKEVTNIDIFAGANNFNPVFDSTDKNIYFLSNRDGFRNLYKYNFATHSTTQLTDYFTGISGITENSPALSISKNDDIVYSYYRSQRYTLYNAKASEFETKTVANNSVDLRAATLPPFSSVGVDIVNKNLVNFLAYSDMPTDSIKTIAYRPQFKLDYIASNGVGVSTSRFGTGMSSGVQAIFSDILSRNQIFAAASVNGEIYDFGAQLAYINQESRWNWGGAISHIPYQTGTYGAGLTNINTSGNTQTSVYEEYIDIIRIFEESAQAFTFYPFNKTTRIEFGTGISHYSYRVDRYSTYYDYYTSGGYVIPTYALYQDKRKISKDEYQNSTGYSLNSFTVYQLNTALVGDNSYSGVAAPLGGYRYRLSLEQNFGTYSYTAPTIDLRKYIRAKPVTFAGRLYGYGRLGDVNKQLYPLFIGYPYLIRGYEANSFYNNSSGGVDGFNINQLMGNRIAVANFEVRLPFTGPEKLSAIESKFLFSDLNLFFDAGLAWDKGQKVEFKKAPSVIGQNPNGSFIYEDVKVPALSAGISARVNVFGYFVLEPYLAIPFNRKDVKKPVFGLAFAPGW